MASNLVGSQWTDAHGKPLMLRDSRLANTNFGLGGALFTHVPKAKFMFYVRFHLGIALQANWSKVLGFAVKSLDRPKISFETHTLNEYNKKRIVQTKVEYQPISFRLHDTIDNRALKMFSSYFNYYYGDGMHDNIHDWDNDSISPAFIQPGTWGLVPAISPTVPGNNNYFFDRIEVYQIYGKHYNQFNLIHPKITFFDPDELDYAAGDSSPEISMAMEFEGYVPKENGALLSNSLISEMGLDKSGFYETGDLPLFDPGLLTGISPRVQQALETVSNVVGATTTSLAAIDQITNSLANNGSNILASTISAKLGFGAIDFGSSFQNSNDGALSFINSGTSSDISSSITAGTNFANVGQRIPNIDNIASSALRGLGAIKGII